MFLRTKIRRFWQSHKLFMKKVLVFSFLNIFPDFVIAPPRIVFGAIAVRLKILALFYSPFPDGVSDENSP